MADTSLLQQGESNLYKSRSDPSGDFGQLTTRQSALPRCSPRNSTEFNQNMRNETQPAYKNLQQLQIDKSDFEAAFRPQSLQDERLQTDEASKSDGSNSLTVVDSIATIPSAPVAELSPLQKLGRRTLLVLLVAAMVELAMVGFLGFMSFGSYNNKVWHKIIISGWATRAISVAALFLRTAADLQASIAAAMLAALALESSCVLFSHVPKISVMRSGTANPRALFSLVMTGLGWTRSITRFGYFVISMATLLLSTTTVIQFSSTILLSDLHLGTLPGLTTQTSLVYAFEYNPTLFSRVTPGGWSFYGGIDFPYFPRNPTWTRNPPSYPAFAEYAETVPPVAGVDDTGLLLRALLPFSDAQSRETLRNYSGKAVVLDSRVSCQRPQLDNMSIFYASSDFRNTLISINGTLSHTVEVSRLIVPQEPIPFYCQSLYGSNSTSICQIQDQHLRSGNRGGTLLSEFSNATTEQIQQARQNFSEAPFITWGTPYLIIESSSLPQTDASGQYIYYNSTFDNSLRFQGRDQWTDVISENGPSNLSISLCYTAWDSANLDVQISGAVNRSEPTAQFVFDSAEWSFSNVLSQLGQGSIANDLDESASAESRGILRLAQKPSWIPAEEDVIPYGVQPLGQMCSDMSLTSSIGSGFEGNVSAILLECPYIGQNGIINSGTNAMMPDISLSTMFYEAMGRGQQDQGQGGRGGSVAFALSSLITVLSSMAYYEQMPQYAKTNNVTQVYFTTVLYPQHHRGFAVVAVVVLIHQVLVVLTLALFLFCTQYTMLGNTWQSMAQVLVPETEGLFATATMATDKEVRTQLKQAGKEGLRASIGLLGGGGGGSGSNSNSDNNNGGRNSSPLDTTFGESLRVGIIPTTSTTTNFRLRSRIESWGSSGISKRRGSTLKHGIAWDEVDEDMEKGSHRRGNLS